MQKNSINKVILVGHIGNKPEGRYTPSGASTASFSVATNETWLDAEKTKQDKTEWHNIVAWNKLADFATEYLQKGQLVCVEGKLQTRSWKDKDENPRKTTEIVCSNITPLGWKNDDSQKGVKGGETNKKTNSDDEDLPF
jgi:single-strand DNA-binding protein